jgi:hypothetical protein
MAVRQYYTNGLAPHMDVISLVLVLPGSSLLQLLEVLCLRSCMLIPHAVVDVLFIQCKELMCSLKSQMFTMEFANAAM